MDHDQRFKAMLREFFADFMRLFFPDWAKCFDLAHPEWLDKEVLPDPPDGERHLLDLVARLKTTVPLAADANTTADEWLAVIHIEVESADRTARLKPRLPRYYVHLRESQELPVLPIVLYLHVGMDGIGVDSVEEFVGTFNVLTFRYLYVGLPALDAVQYAQGDNWLGVSFSALMRAPREDWPRLLAEGIRRIGEAPLTEQQRYLLIDCMEAFAPLDAEGRELYERLTMAEPFSKIVPRNKTTYDRGLEEGMEKGIEKGVEQGAEKTARDIATALLESRFQSLPEAVRARLQLMKQPELRELILKINAASSLDELFPPTA